MNIFKSIFQKERSPEIIRAFYRILGSLDLFGISKRDFIDSGYNYNPDVYSVISFITKKSSSIDFVYKNENNEIVADSDLEQRLKFPNAYMTFYDMIEQLIGYLLITGDAYLYAPRIEAGNNKGKILPDTDIMILPSHLIDIHFTRQGTIDYYALNAQKLNPADVIHINYFNPLADLPGSTGLSPLQAGRLTVSRGNKNYEASNKMFDNLGAVGILSGESDTGAIPLKPHQIKEIKKNLKRQMSGSSNAGEIVVTEAKVNWQRLGVSAADLKLIEDRKMGIKEICNLYHIPSALFGDGDSTQYSNIENARKIAWTDAIIPVIEKVLSKLNNSISSAYGLKIVPNYSEVSELQQDKAKMVQWLSQAWWIKGARKQEIMGEEPDNELDDYFLPAGIMPLNMTNEPTDEEINNFMGETEL